MTATAAQSDFALLEPLGSPGSNVFRARARDGRFVAVRLWRGETQESELFLERLRAARGVRHPMLAALESCDRLSDGTLCTVSEYVPGNTLDVWLSERGLPSLGHVTDFIYRLCMGLNAAHRQGVAHDTPHPGNLVVLEPDTQPGGRIVAKLLDVAVPAAMRPWPPPLEAAHFMAPECLAAQDLDPAAASDARMSVYACGCLLHYLCAGKPPFQSVSVDGLRELHAARRASETLELPPELPHMLARTIRRALALDPLARYADPGELASAIGARLRMHSSGVQTRVSLPPLSAPPPSGRRSVPPPPPVARSSTPPPERSGTQELLWGRRSSPLNERISVLPGPGGASVATAIEPDTHPTLHLLFTRWSRLTPNQRWWVGTGAVMVAAFATGFRLWSQSPSSLPNQAARPTPTIARSTAVVPGGVFVPYRDALDPRLATTHSFAPEAVHCPAPTRGTTPSTARSHARTVAAESASQTAPSALAQRDPTRAGAALDGAKPAPAELKAAPVATIARPETLAATSTAAAASTRVQVSPQAAASASASGSAGRDLAAPALTPSTPSAPTRASSASDAAHQRPKSVANAKSAEPAPPEEQMQASWAEAKLNRLLTVHSSEGATSGDTAPAGEQARPARDDAPSARSEPALQPSAAGHLRVESLAVRGALTTTSVRRAIDRIEPELVECYQQHPAGNGVQTGPVRVDVTVDETGRVRSPSVQSGGPAELNACVSRTSRKFVSVAPGMGTADVSWTLHWKL